MNWLVSFSSKSLKFLTEKNVDKEEIFQLIIKSIKKFQGEYININIKKLKGDWVGFHRIRSGKLRIIAEFNFDNCEVLIEKIDWRGSVYKK